MSHDVQYLYGVWCYLQVQCERMSDCLLSFRLKAASGDHLPWFLWWFCCVLHSQQYHTFDQKKCNWKKKKSTLCPQYFSFNVTITFANRNNEHFVINTWDYIDMLVMNVDEEEEKKRGAYFFPCSFSTGHGYCALLNLQTALYPQHGSNEAQQSATIYSLVPVKSVTKKSTHSQHSLNCSQQTRPCLSPLPVNWREIPL